MKRLAILLVALLAPFASAAATGDEAAGPALTTAPQHLLELLPPGTRGARIRAVGSAERERVALPATSEVGPPRWIEVEYTVDRVLERRVRGVLETTGAELAHVILMDPTSGEVRAYVSSDPARFPATRAYPTASLMKVVTAAALLRNAPEAAREGCRFEGSPWELRPAQLEAPSEGGRVHSFSRALAMSNNQCFARHALQVGEDALLSEMSRLGLLAPPGPGHAPGRVELGGGALSLGHLGSGMAGSFVTPLGAARLAAALAHGELVTPRWVAGAWDADGNPLALPSPQPPAPVWPQPIAERLRDVMIEVVEAGTARRAFRARDGEPMLGGVRVAGKTGTVSGRDPAGRYRWFIGVAPAEAPEVAIATIVVNPQPRGPSAAEVAALSLRSVFCDTQQCDDANAGQLRARARDREAAVADELAKLRQRARDAEARARLAELRRAEELDRMPRPLGSPSFDFPGRLRRRSVDGEIVLLLDLDPRGEVLDIRIASSDLPDFEDYVLSEVWHWKFTPPTQYGRPVEARARLPITIRVN